MTWAALVVVWFSVNVGVYVALAGGDKVDVCGRQQGWSAGADVGGR